MNNLINITQSNSYNMHIFCQIKLINKYSQNWFIIYMKFRGIHSKNTFRLKLYIEISLGSLE